MPPREDSVLSTMQDVPLLISDALFNADGSLAFDVTGDKGLWGDIILVNGVPWPTMKVKPRIYRFRVLIGSIHNRVTPSVDSRELALPDVAAIAPIVLVILALAFFPQFGLRRSEASLNATIASTQAGSR